MLYTTINSRVFNEIIKKLKIQKGNIFLLLWSTNTLGFLKQTPNLETTKEEMNGYEDMNEKLACDRDLRIQIKRQPENLHCMTFWEHVLICQSVCLDSECLPKFLTGSCPREERGWEAWIVFGCPGSKAICIK